MSNNELESVTDSSIKFTDSPLMSAELLHVVDEVTLQHTVHGELYHNPTLYRQLRTRDERLTAPTVRELVEIYYELQQFRLSVATRYQKLQTANAPSLLTAYYAEQLQRLESSMVRPLDSYVKQYLPGRWALQQYGIGPVLAAGLVAYIDITKAPTTASVWRYAGLDPSLKWTKGTKRPWNPELKTLSWKIGVSFARFADSDECVYGQLYLYDKQRRTAKNEAGDYTDAAATALRTGDWDATTQATLAAGRLPDSQIDAQARRYAVKIFLSHYHAVAYQDHHHIPAPRPYVIEHGGVDREIPIPHFPF